MVFNHILASFLRYQTTAEGLAKDMYDGSYCCGIVQLGIQAISLQSSEQHRSTALMMMDVHDSKIKSKTGALKPIEQLLIASWPICVESEAENSLIEIWNGDAPI